MLTVITGKAARRDPTTFIAAFSMWAMLCGFSLILPGNIFERTNIYQSLDAILPQDYLWGWAMFLDGAALQVSIFIHRVSVKSSVAAFSAVLWMMLGSLIMMSAWANHFFSVSGAFSIWGALGCFLAITQWIYNPED